MGIRQRLALREIPTDYYLDMKFYAVVIFGLRNTL